MYNRRDMRTAVGLGLILVALAGLAACGGDQREWLKVDARYTKEEFQRDYRACSRGGDVDEACMRQRGWVPVSPSKSETPQTSPSSRGRPGY